MSTDVGTRKYTSDCTNFYFRKKKTMLRSDCMEFHKMQREIMKNIVIWSLVWESEYEYKPGSLYHLNEMGLESGS